MATEGVRQLLQELKDAKKEVHQKDVEDLMQSFVQLDATSFAAFKSLWVLRRFSFIFEGRPPQVPGREFMQNLYSASLGGLSSGSSLRQRCAAIYMLYALYFGQPFRPRVLIYLGLDKLRELQVAAAEFQEGEGGEDALAVLRALQEERALLFGAFSVDPPTVAEFMTQRLTDAGRAIRVMNSRLLGKLPVESHIGESLKGALPVQEATLAAAKYARALAAVEEVGGPEAAQLMAREPVLPAVLALARDFDTRREKLLAEVRQRAGTAAQEPLLVALECLARTGLKRTTASMNKKKKQKVEEGEAAETEAEAEAAVAQLEGQREPSEGEGSDLAFDEDMLAAELEAGMLEEVSVLRIDDQGVEGSPEEKSRDPAASHHDFAAELEAGMLEEEEAGMLEEEEAGMLEEAEGGMLEEAEAGMLEEAEAGMLEEHNEGLEANPREGSTRGADSDSHGGVGASTVAEVGIGVSENPGGGRGGSDSAGLRASEQGHLNGGSADQAGRSSRDWTRPLGPSQGAASAHGGQECGATSKDLGSHREEMDGEGDKSRGIGMGTGDHLMEENESEEFEYLDADTEDDEASGED